MAQHNPQSRAYLLIVLGAIAVGFAIAALFLGGGDSETATGHGTEHKAQTAGPAPEVPVNGKSHGRPDGKSMDETPPDREPVGGEGMTDDLSPPDEMIDEPLLDGAANEAAPDRTSERPAPEAPAPADNP